MANAPKRLDYRPAPPSRVRIWVREHAAEWLVGLGWTLVGTGGIVIGIGWLFVALEPRHTPAAVYSWLGLGVAGLGLLLSLGSLGLGVHRDGILRTVLVATLLLAAVVFGVGLMLPSRQEAAPPSAPLPASAFQGEASPGATEAVPGPGR